MQTEYVGYPLFVRWPRDRTDTCNPAEAERALHLVLGCCTLATQEECTGRVREVYDAIRSGQPLPYSVGTLAAKLRNRDREYGRASATIGILRGALARDKDVFRRVDKELDAMRAEQAGHLALLLWLHAEAVWQRDRLDDEALKWTEVAGQHAEDVEKLRAERDELRAHGVARDIGEANNRMRAQLATYTATDEQGRPLYGRISYGDEDFPRVTVDPEDVGQPDTEATEQAAQRKSCPECSAQPWRPHRDDCPVTLHEQEMREIADQPVTPANPTEPRVWSVSDVEPAGVTAVTTPGGAVFNRSDDRRWRSESVMHGHAFTWSDLVNGYPFMTEVVVDGAPAEDKP